MITYFTYVTAFSCLNFFTTCGFLMKKHMLSLKMLIKVLGEFICIWIMVLLYPKIILILENKLEFGFIITTIGIIFIYSIILYFWTIIIFKRWLKGLVMRFSINFKNKIKKIKDFIKKELVEVSVDDREEALKQKMDNIKKNIKAAGATGFSDFLKNSDDEDVDNEKLNKDGTSLHGESKDEQEIDMNSGKNVLEDLLKSKMVKVGDINTEGFLEKSKNIDKVSVEDFYGVEDLMADETIEFGHESIEEIIDEEKIIVTEEDSLGEDQISIEDIGELTKNDDDLENDQEVKDSTSKEIDNFISKNEENNSNSGLILDDSETLVELENLMENLDEQEKDLLEGNLISEILDVVQNDKSTGEKINLQEELIDMGRPQLEDSSEVGLDLIKNYDNFSSEELHKELNNELNNDLNEESIEKSDEELDDETDKELNDETDKELNDETDKELNDETDKNLNNERANELDEKSVEESDEELDEKSVEESDEELLEESDEELHKKATDDLNYKLEDKFKNEAINENNETIIENNETIIENLESLSDDLLTELRNQTLDEENHNNLNLEEIKIDELKVELSDKLTANEELEPTKEVFNYNEHNNEDSDISELIKESDDESFMDTISKQLGMNDVIEENKESQITLNSTEGINDFKESNENNDENNKKIENKKDNNQNLQFNGSFDNIESKQEVEEYDSALCDQYINKAFELKNEKDYQGAIENFMLALDNSNENDVIFWIILDICTLYKQINQSELAKDILNSYYESYQNLMSKEILEEIKNNL